VKKDRRTPCWPCRNQRRVLPKLGVDIGNLGLIWEPVPLFEGMPFTSEGDGALRRPCVSPKFSCDRRGKCDYLLVIGSSAMRTTILAYIIAFAGLVTIFAGAWGFFSLVTEKTVRVPRRYYAVAIGMICGGFGLVGIAQALRLLLAISGKG
jgi:hypothetical protein